MERNKENVFSDYKDTVVNSWTYDRMTEEEKDRCFSVIIFAKNQNLLSGTYRQRWQQLNAVYNAFLLGLGYDGPTWREVEEVPFCVGAEA